MASRLCIRHCRNLSCFLPNTISSKVGRPCFLGRQVHICSRRMSKNTMEGSQADSSAKEPKQSDQPIDPSKKISSRQRLSLVFAEYGVTAVVFHTGISLASLGLCYVAVSSGIDVPGFLVKIGVSESVSQSVAAKGASTFVIAYACHKVFMPLRIFMTVTCTPLIVHRLRRLGLIK